MYFYEASLEKTGGKSAI